MLAHMTDDEWEIVLEVFQAVRSRRGGSPQRFSQQGRRSRILPSASRPRVSAASRPGVCATSRTSIRAPARAGVGATARPSIGTASGTSVSAATGPSIGTASGASVSAAAGPSVRASPRPCVCPSAGASVHTATGSSVARPPGPRVPSALCNRVGCHRDRGNSDTQRPHHFHAKIPISVSRYLTRGRAVRQAQRRYRRSVAACAPQPA